MTSFSSELKAKARRLLELHHGPRTLVLVNVWDAASARVVEQAGAPALATTSAGVANMLGYPDGEQVPRDEMLAIVRRIAAVAQVPVTADMEAGYGETPEAVAETALAVMAAGAVGMNLEDSREHEPRLFDLSRQQEKIRAVREAARRAGVSFVLNARTDSYLNAIGTPEQRFEETLRRGAAYRDAGADCIFVPGLADAEVIGRLVQELKCPLNILASAKAPPVPELEKLGVARVSCGSTPMRATMGLLRRISEEIQQAGTYATSVQNAIGYDEANRLFEGRTAVTTRQG